MRQKPYVYVPMCIIIFFFRHILVSVRKVLKVIPCHIPYFLAPCYYVTLVFRTSHLAGKISQISEVNRVALYCIVQDEALLLLRVVKADPHIDNVI